MLRFRKFLPVAALLVGAALLGAPNQARAGYAVQVYDDNVLQGGIFSFVSGNSLVFFGSTTHFSITNGSGLSNNPGTQALSNLSLSSNEQISTTFGAGGGTHTIKIVLSQDGWLAPTGTPLVLSASAGGSYAGTNAGNSVVAHYQGFLDPSNALFGTPGSGGTPVLTASASGVPTPPNLTKPLVFAPATGVSIVPGGTPFSMTDVLTFTFNVTPGSGQDTANVSASTAATAVPAPAGLALALAGLPVLGIGGWLRRRRQSV
jgi:hypothetical protein